ncbi:MAG: bifunctional 3-(3-hydroxy-phenyl)propionate/3-hydroxycinnamic acid hydroxylase [Ktedonobacteraceae bacterium]
MQHNTPQQPTTIEEQAFASSVVIVGAGPTGLTAANLLGMAGIKTLVLERNAALSAYPKAITIDDEGLRICQAMGLIDEIVNHTVLDIEAHYLSARHFLVKVSPTSRRNGYPLISTFHQPAFEAVLLQGLDRFPCVEVRFQHTVETFAQDLEQVTLSMSTPDGTHSTVACDYLLACDGGKSPIRHALNISMYQPTLLPRRPRQNRRETDRGQRWLVVDTSNDDDTSTAATFFCEYTRPAVTVPAPQHARRWEFMLLSGERDADLLADEIIHELIRQARASHPTSHLETQDSKPHIVRKTIYTFRSVVAQRFMQGRVFLLGDAAHLMPPFGGQGMNSGLRDAHNLCWKLQLVLQGQTSPKLLETYHMERYPHVKEMILFSSLLGNIVMTTTRRASQLRDWFFTIVNAIPPLRDAITEMRVKPQPQYRKGFLLPTRNRKNKRLVGALLPQPYVLARNGEKILLDDVLGDGFALLRLYKKPEQAFEGVQEDTWEQLGVKPVCVLPQGVSFAEYEHEKCEVVSDMDGKLGDFLRHKQDIFVVVRPDRYVMGVFRATETQEAHKPMFLLKPADGAMGAHLQSVKGAYIDFEKLARTIAEHTGISLRERYYPTTVRETPTQSPNNS